MASSRPAGRLDGSGQIRMLDADGVTMRRNHEQAADQRPLTADEIAYLDRALAADGDAVANDLAMHLALPYEQVRAVIDAHVEAVATLTGEPTPTERRFFPAGSLPPLPADASDEVAMDAAEHAVRTRLAAHGIPQDVVDTVQDHAVQSEKLRRRTVRRNRWAIAVGAVIGVLALIGTIVGDQTSPSPAPGDLDPAWEPQVTAALEPFAADQVDVTELTSCFDEDRDGRVIAIGTELAEGTTYAQLADALDQVGLPADADGRFTYVAENEDDPDAGHIVMLDRAERWDGPEFVRVYSPCVT